LEFAFVAVSAQASLKPRKQPVQARSASTVAALYEASIQVLLAVGYRKFTTTRVAARAGVSVGSLYQYFPNRQALIAAVIERHMEEMLATIERRCREHRGQSLEAMVEGLVDAVVAAKWERLEISRALHEPLAEVRGAECVQAAALKMAEPLADILRSCSDASFRDEQRLALLIVVACNALLQTAITDKVHAFDMAALRAHMRAFVLGYLREMRVREPRRARMPA
jgi:AcrR family transcriptional regulator